MPLPPSCELREMLEYASPHPWRREGGFIRPARENATWSIAAIEDEGGQIGGDDDIDFLLLAPQLAEEVIRLREEIDRVKELCLNKCRSAEAAKDPASKEVELYLEGQQVAYYEAYLQLDKALHKEEKNNEHC